MKNEPKVNDMKLSEAILKGCQVTLPLLGSYQNINPDGTSCACTLGAASFGVDPRSKGHHNCGKYFIEDNFGINILKHPPVNALPLIDEDGTEYRSLFDQVSDLNDSQLKTREEIANGLAAAGL